MSIPEDANLSGGREARAQFLLMADRAKSAHAMVRIYCLTIFLVFKQNKKKQLYIKMRAIGCVEKKGGFGADSDKSTYAVRLLYLYIFMDN